MNGRLRLTSPSGAAVSSAIRDEWQNGHRGDTVALKVIAFAGTSLRRDDRKPVSPMHFATEHAVLLVRINCRFSKCGHT